MDKNDRHSILSELMLFQENSMIEGVKSSESIDPEGLVRVYKVAPGVGFEPHKKWGHPRKLPYLKGRFYFYASPDTSLVCKHVNFRSFM